MTLLCDDIIYNLLNFIYNYVSMKKIRDLKYLNKTLLILTIIYAILGAFLILDASSISATHVYGESTPYYFFIRQLGFIIAGLIGGVVILFVDTKHYKLLSLLLTGTFIFLLLTAYGKSLIRSGVQEVTLSLLGGSLQPAEFLKVFLIIYLGAFYGSWANKEHKKWSFVIPLILAGISFSIILLAGDFGSAAIMAALFALIFIAVPIKKDEKLLKWLKIIALFGMILAIIFLKFGYKIIPESKLSSGRFNRFLYTNPCDRYEENSGYQVCNGYIAIDNGGLFGVGIGNSVQKYMYLPASHTDFIFPIIVEEFGVISGIVIIIGYMVITYFIFRIASNTYKLQNSLICYGIGIYFMLHIFVNLCGVLGIIPLTGVPLPFLSYGGSFCLVLLCSFGVVQRINIENMKERRERILKKSKEN